MEELEAFYPNVEPITQLLDQEFVNKMFKYEIRADLVRTLCFT